jgi:hypothetical protein
MTTVWIYVDTRYRVGDPGHLKVFADEEAANRWLEENDPDGVAFEYEVLEWNPAAILTAARPAGTKATVTSWEAKAQDRVETYDIRRNDIKVR